MINENKAIVVLDTATIVLDELGTLDLTSDDPANDRQELNYGAVLPFININSYNIHAIDYIKINMNSEIPELFIMFRIYETQFLYTGYPKDGDLLCLYIKSNSSLYYPIRHDYTIVEVNGPGPAQVPGNGKSSISSSVFYKFTIKAQLRIPKIFQQSSKAYPSFTSLQTLRAIAKELNLGFATNENDTEDRMTWICPNQSNLEFINSVVESSWKTEEDSFEWWIDTYYNLTFVNINKQLFGANSSDSDTILAAIGNNQEINGGLNSTQKNGEYEFPLVLTNNPYYAKYPFFINSYSVKNGAGYVVNKYGYKTILQFYDPSLSTSMPADKYVKYDVESVTPQQLGPNDIILRGRPNEDVYKYEHRKQWLGTTYLDNTHNNIQQAPTQNLLNRMENYKIFLEIELNSYASWVYRVQIIPIAIVHTAPKDIAGQIGDKTKPRGTEVNFFLSGNYIILGISLEYKNATLKTILRLGKREWTINDGLASQPEPIIPTS